MIHTSSLMSCYHSSGLGDAVSEHVSQFLAHCMCGEDLLKLNQQQLEYLKDGNYV